MARSRAAVAEVTLALSAPGRVRVEGRVSHVNARAAWEATNASLGAILAADAARIEIDLTDVTSGNSLVLSLMLSWLRQARTTGREIRFTGVPPALGEQIRFTGLAHILPLETEVKA
jgi:phospholipid transport system transporter-binding protein